jgi:CRISPR system Cascade subunit CasD
MPTLLMRLEGPMQSWGTQSRFTVRDTGLEPSKSGVIGLCCAALGIDREDDEALALIAQARMGVRIDHPGSLERDYHTVGGGTPPGLDRYGVYKASTKPGSKATGDTVPSTRYYLAGASFLVGLEHDDPALLQRIDAALGAPRWPLFLGRKSHVPSKPVRVPSGVCASGLLEALAGEPWTPLGAVTEPPSEGLRLVVEFAPAEAEVEEGTLQVRQDQPLSFRNGARRFALRRVRSSFLRREAIDTGRGEPCISPASS